MRGAREACSSHLELVDTGGVSVSFRPPLLALDLPHRQQCALCTRRGSGHSLPLGISRCAASGQLLPLLRWRLWLNVVLLALMFLLLLMLLGVVVVVVLLWSVWRGGAQSVRWCSGSNLIAVTITTTGCQVRCFRSIRNRDVGPGRVD